MKVKRPLVHMKSLLLMLCMEAIYYPKNKSNVPHVQITAVIYGILILKLITGD